MCIRFQHTHTHTHTLCTDLKLAALVSVAAITPRQ